MESWGLHAVIYPKNKFTLEEAKANFAENHKPKFMRETKASYRYRVIPKTRFSQYRSKKLPNGSTLIYGELLPKWQHLHGSGFFDKIKSVAKNVVSKIASVPGKIAEQFTRRHNYNNTSKRTLDKHANEVITKMVIVRTPIMAILDKVFNVLTLGSWKTAKEQAGYDKMFHLQLRINDILVEKNEVINITENLSSITDKSEQLAVTSFPNITIGEFMQKAEDSMGSSYWLYDAFTNNCQNFIIGLLSANGCLTEEAKAFIYQPVEELVKRIPKYMNVIAKGATGIGAVANRLMGKGEDGRFELSDTGGVPWNGKWKFLKNKQYLQRRIDELKKKYAGYYLTNYFLKDVDDGTGHMKHIWNIRANAEAYDRANPQSLADGFKDAFNVVKLPLSFIPGVGQALDVADGLINGGSRNSGYISALVKGKFKNKKFDLSKMKDPSEWLKKKYIKQDDRIIKITELIKEFNEVHVPRLAEFDKNIDAETDAKKKEIMSVVKSKREAKKLLDKWIYTMQEKKRILQDEYYDLLNRIRFLQTRIMMRKKLPDFLGYTPEEIKEFDQRNVDRLAKISIPKLRFYVSKSEALDAHAPIKRTIGMGKKELTEDEKLLKKKIMQIKKGTKPMLEAWLRDNATTLPDYRSKNKKIEEELQRLQAKGKKDIEGVSDDDKLTKLKYFNFKRELKFIVENATRATLLSYILGLPEFQPIVPPIAVNEFGRTEEEQIEYNIRKAIKKDLIDFILSMPELAKLYVAKEPKVKLTKAMLASLGLKGVEGKKIYKNWTDEQRKEKIEALARIDRLSKAEIIKALRETYTPEQLRKLGIRVSKGLDDLKLDIASSGIPNIF